MYTAATTEQVREAARALLASELADIRKKAENASSAYAAKAAQQAGAAEGRTDAKLDKIAHRLDVCDQRVDDSARELGLLKAASEELRKSFGVIEGLKRRFEALGEALDRDFASVRREIEARGEATTALERKLQASVVQSLDKIREVVRDTLSGKESAAVSRVEERAKSATKAVTAAVAKARKEFADVTRIRREDEARFEALAERMGLELAQAKKERDELATKFDALRDAIALVSGK